MRTPNRFLPVRAGIVNLYEYDDQVFELADGRLLLRGHNTSGKTKALELLLPFCLDGDINPRKLDPFAKSAKEMKWNLVGCVENEQRIGYVWLEFARLVGDRLEHVTAGIGMKANRGRDGVQRWYFLVRDRRVGHDLGLRRGDYPVTRRELAELLGDADELLGSPSEYRRRLNDVVYGFPSVDQYETMIGLLLELRRPHLSKALNAADVARLLSASLPEVDHGLMRRLGEGLEQLDDLQAALSTLEAVRERVERFNRSAYQAYARAVIAERGERLRRSETGYGRASTLRRECAERLKATGERAAQLEGELREARTRLQSTEGEREGLLQSTEWAAVAEVEQLARTAGQARLAADGARSREADASARLAADEADAIAARAVAREAVEALAEATATLAVEGAGAGLTARHESLAPALEEPGRAPATVGALLGEEAQRCLVVLEEHGKLLEALAAAAAEHERGRTAREDAELTLRGAAERRAELEGQVEDAREAVVEAIEAWAAELAELQLEPDVRERALELASLAGADGADPPRRAWQQAFDRCRDELVAARSVELVRRDDLAARRAALEEARALVLAERDESPPASHTRPAQRGGRSGAPLWGLVDFASGLAPEETAGLEAALEGAGLLDAWVTPDGIVRDAATLDLLLDATTPRAPGATLIDVLVPVAGAPVEEAAVRRILEAVALVEDPGAAVGTAVSRSGRFRLGPACGHFAKPAAEYIGAAARAARRARRRAELEAQIAGLEGEATEIAAGIVRLDERLDALRADGERFPDVAALASARRALSAGERSEAACRTALAEREREVTVAAERRARAQTVLQGHAESCQLPEGLDRAAVRARETAAHRYQAAIPGAVRAAVRRNETAARVTDLEQRLEVAGAGVAELGQLAERAEAEARRMEAEHAERAAMLGSTGEQVHARMQAVQQRISGLRSDIQRLEKEDKAAAVDQQRHEDELARAGEALEGAVHERDGALAALKRLEDGDVFVLALADDAPEDHARAAEWTLTRALEVLRGIPPARLAVRSSPVSLANQVQQRCGELDRALSQQADMSVVAESDADGLVVVRVRQGPRTLTIAELTARLTDEIAERERTLSAEQRRVFNDTLLEEIAEHLRARIERVGELVSDMNATLAQCPTASGKTVQLEWGTRETTGHDDVQATVRLLRRSVATLGEAERGQLVEFFRERIQHARDETALGAPEAGEPGAAAHLREAFDYRDWFAFTLHQVHHGQRLKLTAKLHAMGSGGEQAVLIHMPLFAAAAALYSSSRDGRAPRLVMLDEALSGIDDETREKVLGVLVDLDLDIVMTSHELWGTYRTVPSLSIYQLHRENGAFGVASEHFLWDGESLRELEQAGMFD